MKQITAKHYAKIQPFVQVQCGSVRNPNIVFINAVLCFIESGCKWVHLMFYGWLDFTLLRIAWIRRF